MPISQNKAQSEHCFLEEDSQNSKISALPVSVINFSSFFAERINLFGLIQVLQEKLLVPVILELLKQLFECFSAIRVLLLDCRTRYVSSFSRINFWSFCPHSSVPPGKRVGAVEEEEDEEQEEIAPEAGPTGEPAISSDLQENAPLQVARDPGDPLAKKRQDNNATHIHFRAWCPICVKAKGREEAHRNERGKKSGSKDTISFDDKTFGKADDRDDKATAIVYEDDHTKMMFGNGASDARSLRR